MGLFSKKSNDIGIDLGTANILIYRRGEGIILNEPSLVAIDTVTNKVLTVGKEASAMLGRTSKNIKLVRPLKDGVIADFDITASMLKIFLEKLKVGGAFSFSQPRILICCPTEITTVEKDAIKKVAEKCGAREVFVEVEPKLAAIGAGLEIFQPLGNMVIDIGGGTTDIAILSMGDVVTASTLRNAGERFTNSIIEYIKAKYHLLVGYKMAEKIKFELGVVMDPDPEKVMDINGRDQLSGLPKKLTISEVDVYTALESQIKEIVHETKLVLERTEPEIAFDIYNQGIVLTGGGAMLKNFDLLLEKEVNVPVYIVDDPLNTVAKGSGILLELDADRKSNVSLK